MKDNLVEIQAKDKLHICTDLKYNLGGFQSFSLDKDSRGYFLHVKPVTIDGQVSSFGAFSGFKYLIRETKRKSYKAYIGSLKLLIESYEYLIKNMIIMVCKQEEIEESKVDGIFNETMKQLKDHLKKVSA